MRDQIRLVDEPTTLADPHCILCGSGQLPFLAFPVPVSLVADIDMGEFLLCPDCFGAACAAGSVVAKHRFEDVLERAQEAERINAALQSNATNDAATIARLENELVQVEAQATSAKGERDAAMRRIDELLADPAIQAREQLKARLAAAGQSKSTGRRKVAA